VTVLTVPRRPAPAAFEHPAVGRYPTRYGASPPDDVVLPDADAGDRPWNGLLVGVYVRNSKQLQVGNARSLFQSEDFPNWCLRNGFGIKVYQEQGVSGGKTIGDRKQAARMVRDLVDERIDAVGAVEVSRLTRDEYGYDCIEIVRKTRRRGGLLVTMGKVWDLRNKWDLRQFEDAAKYASRERFEIRDRFHEGLWVAGRLRPMVRSKPTLGYRRVPVLGPDGAPAVNRFGRVERDWAKDPEHARTVEVVRRALHELPTLPEVAAALNRRGVPSPWEGMHRNPWRSSILRTMIKNPMYVGDLYPLCRPDRTPGEVWDQFEGDPRDVVHHVEELKYWSRAEAKMFREKFLEREGPRTRHRKHDHLLLKILVCRTCGLELSRGGAYTDRQHRLQARYQCPALNFSAAACPDPQHINEESAFAALTAAVPAMVAAVEERLEAAARARASQRGPTAEEAQLAEHRDRLQQILDDWFVPGRRPPRPIADEAARLQDEITRLEGLVEDAADRAELTAAGLEAVEALVKDPQGVFVKIGEVTGREAQAAILRLLCRNVVVEHNGRPGKARRFWVAKWEPVLVDNASKDTTTPGVTSYLRNLHAALQSA
jgi:DNA invertase Pin-like site-specific DNA recombinase